MLSIQFAQQSHEENKKELETALIKQRALVEDVKRSAAIAGSEQDRKTQMEQIKNDRIALVEKVRGLSDENRKYLKLLNEENQPRLRSINNKIKEMENSKNVRLEV